MDQEAIDLSEEDNVFIDMAEELDRATMVFGPMHSSHEAYAVILEELEEFWDEVKQKPARRDKAAMRKELIQVGAMCARTILDLEL